MTHIIPVRAVSSGSEPRGNITLRAYVRTYARRKEKCERTYVRTYVRRDPDPLSSTIPPTYVRTYVRTYVSILCMCCEGFTLELQKRERERERAYVRTYVPYVRTHVRMQGELFLATLSLAPFDHERASAPRRRSQLPSGLPWGGEHRPRCPSRVMRAATCARTVRALS